MGGYFACAIIALIIGSNLGWHDGYGTGFKDGREVERRKRPDTFHTTPQKGETP